MEVVAGETWSRRFCRNKAVCYSEGRERTIRSMKQNLTAAMSKVFKWLHCPLDAMLLCVRWYVAYPLSLRHVEEMMAERGIAVDHSTVHRWAIKLLPLLEKAIRRCKRTVGRSGRMDETYVRIGGSGDISTGPSTKPATRLISCCEHAGTKLLRRHISSGQSR